MLAFPPLLVEPPVLVPPELITGIGNTVKESVFYELLEPPGLSSVRVIPIEYDPTVLAPVGINVMEFYVSLANGTAGPRLTQTFH